MGKKEIKFKLVTCSSEGRDSERPESSESKKNVYKILLKKAFEMMDKNINTTR